jgi:hypothetical protein
MPLAARVNFSAKSRDNRRLANAEIFRQ